MGVTVCNANKLEIALGYYTYRGDDVGIFAPLGDLTKVEIFEMCKFINEKYSNLIPKEMLPDENFDFPENGIAPSAELKEDQLDPMKFGYHDRLIELLMNYIKYSPEDFLQWYIDGEFVEKVGITEEIYRKYKLDDPKIFLEDLEWFIKKIQQNVFKRIQAPPIVLLSKTAFGFDLRESQFSWEPTLLYNRLAKEIKTKNLEIERKFKVTNLPSTEMENNIGIEIKQGYMDVNGSTVRVRTYGDKGFLTVKKKIDDSKVKRYEFEYEIPLEEALTMLDVVCGSVLSKTRYCIPYKEHIWELDVFHDYYDGVVVVEVELDSEDEEFEKPSWVGEEVTSQTKYINEVMCRGIGI